MSITLKRISYDLMEIIRSGSVSQSETISIRQIESWIAEYRSLLVRREFEKNYYISPTLIQSINCIELEQIDRSECCGITTCKVLRSTVTIPKFVRTSTGGDLFLYASSAEGKPYQITSESGAYWRQFRKWIDKDIYVFIKNSYLYVVGTGTLEKISIRGVFEDPMSIANYTSGCTGQPCWSVDSDYPIPKDMLPILKGMILKQELGIEVSSASDKTNDASNIQTPNTKKG